MRILYAGDFHMRDSYGHDKRGEERMQQTLDWFLHTARETNPHAIVLGGDLVDSPKYVTFKVLQKFYNFVTQLVSEQSSRRASRCVSITRETGPLGGLGGLQGVGESVRLSKRAEQTSRKSSLNGILSKDPSKEEVTWTDNSIFVLLGNHDGVKGSSILSILPEQIIRIEDPVDVLIREYRIRFYPYVKTISESYRPARGLSRARVCFAHLGVVELQLGGEAFGPFTFDDLNSDVVVSGHYHLPSRFYGGRWIYPGAVLPRSFADASSWPIEESFGACLVHVDAEDVWTEKLANPHAAYYLKLTNPTAELLSDVHAWKGGEVLLSIACDDPNDYEGVEAARVVAIHDDEDAPTVDVSSVEHALRSYVHARAPEELDHAAVLRVGLELLGTRSAHPLRTPWHLVRLEAHNFLSIAEAHLEGLDGLVVIDGENLDAGGSNGSGKSALVEALFWCLYGTTIRGSKKSDVARRSGGAVRVSVRLVRGSETLHVERSDRALCVWHDDHEIEIDSDKRGKTEYVAGLVGTREVFLLTVLFSRASHSIAEDTATTRSDALLAFLDLGLDEALRRAKVDTKKMRERFLILDSEREQFERLRLERYRASLAELERLQASLDRKLLVSAQKELVDVRARLKRARASLAGETIAELQNASAQALASAQAIERTRDRLGEDVARATQALADFEAAPVDEEHVCKACLQVIPRALAERTRARMRDEAQASQARLAEYESTSVGERETLHAMVDALAVRIGLQREALTEARFAEARERELQRFIDTLGQYGIAEMRAAKSRARRIKEEVWEHADALAVAREELAVLEFWCEGFSRRGIPLYLVSGMIDFVAARANAYLAVLLSGWRMQWTAHEAGVDLALEHAGVEVAYASLSDGQKTCVGLAAQFALHDVQRLSLGGLALVVFDEAIAALDKDASLRALELLREKLAANIRAAWYISHRDHEAMTDVTQVRATLEHGVTHYEVRRHG